MNLPGKKKKPDLAPWRPVAVVQEVLAHATLVAVAWYGGLGYFGVIAVWVAELLIVNLLSTVMYPERGVLRHLGDLIKFVLVMAFLLMFVVLTYGIGQAHENEALGVGWEQLRNLDRDVIVWAVAFAVVHLMAMLIWARAQPQPKREWARVALMQSAATFVALFCLIFVVAFASEFVISGIEWIAPDVAKDDILAFLAVGVRFGFALLVSRMPEKDLDEIAKQPYNDRA